MPTTAVILQSNYIPWRGYFDLMRRADLFIVLDVVQFTKNDWRNRNLIKTPTGLQWLTIPVRASLGEATPIDEVVVADTRWATKHIKSLKQSYNHAACYNAVSPWLLELIESLRDQTQLSAINVKMLRSIAERLKIATPIVDCTELLARDAIIAAGPSRRLVELCRKAGVSNYLSGPAAKDYLDVALFKANGMSVEWMSYEGYPPYPQLWGAFDPKVSIVDLLLNVGAQADSYFPPIGRKA